MRILHATTFLTGGAGRVLLDLALAQRRAGCELFVLANETEYPGYQHYGEYPEALRAVGIETLFTNSTFKRDFAAQQFAAAELRAFFRERGGPPDLVHAHAAVPGLVASMAWAGADALEGGTLAPPPVVMTMHGWGLNKTSEMEAADVAAMNERFACVVALNESGSRLLMEKGVKSDFIKVVPNGIAREASRLNKNKKPPRKEGGFDFLCVGDLGPRKNQILIAAAMKLLAERGLKARTTFVGGEERPGYFEKQMRPAAGTGSIDWRGRRKDAAAIMPEFDAVILSSRSEGFPLVILEAFRAGVPFFGSNVPEIAEVIHHGQNGFLFPTETPAALADLLELFLLGQLPDVKQKARADFLARYTLKTMVAAYEKLYCEVLRAST